MKDSKMIHDLIKSDEYMINILRIVESLNMKDSWISAGFVRNKIWDTIHNYSIRTPYQDIDVIYYDKQNLDEVNEKKYEAQLRKIEKNIPWSVKNQARMHMKSGFNQFRDSRDAVNHYPETPTAICVRLKNEELEIHYDYSVSNLFNGVVAPTKYFNKESNKYKVYLDRIDMKQWHKIWSNLNFKYD